MSSLQALAVVLAPPTVPADRPSQVVRREITRDDVKACNAAANAAGAWLSYEDRLDLRQELALKLVAAEKKPTNVYAWALVCARNLAASFVRDSERRRELLAENYAAGPSGRSYLKGENWRPTWYPPHPDAREFAPFAMKEARVMHVGKGGKR